MFAYVYVCGEWVLLEGKFYLMVGMLNLVLCIFMLVKLSTRKKDM